LGPTAGALSTKTVETLLDLSDAQGPWTPGLIPGTMESFRLVLPVVVLRSGRLTQMRQIEALANQRRSSDNRSEIAGEG
jgi:hypothetical protein